VSNSLLFLRCLQTTTTNKSQEKDTMAPTQQEGGVEATLQYLAKDSTTIVATTYHASEAGTKTEGSHEGEFSFHKVLINNGRGKDLDLDKEGFQLLPHKSAVRDFYNEEEIDTIYNVEVEELLKQALGARRIHIFDHTRRASSSDIRTTAKSREPSSVIHNDYTESSARKRLGDMLGEEEAKTLAQGRFAIVNVWRSIDGIVESWPLTMCDSTTVDTKEDLIAVKRVAKNRIGELQMALFNPNHQWYYFPKMNDQEVTLIKTYDSALDGTNRFTIHTAFDYSTTDGRVAKPRQSIETRAFVFY
jgi:hypothetical protein